jgi:DNA (cytosine-5)-methyltransferase 1
MTGFLKYGSFFTGVGVFDLAAKKEGFEVVFGCENDIYARTHFIENNPGVILYGDIKEVKEVPYVDFLAFGFPCQDASNANSNKYDNPLEQPRTGLFYEAVRLIRGSKPLFFVAENVRALLNKGLETCLHELTSCGYHVGYAIIPASSFGAVHLRQRVFIVGHANCIGRHTCIRVLNNVLVEGSKRQLVERQFHGELSEKIRSQAPSLGYRDIDGATDWVFEGFAVKAGGNAIYYPIAESLTREIKKEIELFNLLPY